MDTEQLQGSFRRGILPLIILSLLKTGDMYGYQLVQETANRSGGAIVTQEGSLYPVLYRLQDAGLVSNRRVLVGRRMTRVYYHLEPSGEAHLEQLAREYRSICEGVMRIMEGQACETCAADAEEVS